MSPPESDSFVHAGTVGDLMTARVVAALLESAGIRTRLRSESMGPYPVTVGRLAATEIFVPGPDVDEARRLIEEAQEGPEPGSAQLPPARLGAMLLAAVLALAAIGLALRVF